MRGGDDVRGRGNALRCCEHAFRGRRARMCVLRVHEYVHGHGVCAPRARENVRVNVHHVRTHVHPGSNPHLPTLLLRREL